jgi:hypothetical protein
MEDPGCPAGPVEGPDRLRVQDPIHPTIVGFRLGGPMKYWCP